MPYTIKDLDDCSVFLYACLLNSQQNGGKLNLSNVVDSLGVKERWAKAVIAKAKQVTTARIDGAGDGTIGADGEEGGPVDVASRDTKKTKRKAADDDEEEFGTDNKRKTAKVRKIRAKKVKVDGSGELDGDGED